MNAPAPAPAPVPQAAGFSCPGRPRPLARRLAIHNRVLKQVRDYLEDTGFNEVPVSALASVNTTCEATDTSFVVDHCGHLAFARQSAQLELDGMLARGFPAVWCESESLRREWKVDERHLTGFKLIEAEQRDLDLDGLCDLQGRLLKHVATGLGADLLGGRHVTRLDRLVRMDLPRMTYREALKVLNSRGWSMSFGEDLHRDAEASLVRYGGHLPLLVTHLPAELKSFNLRRDAADPEVTLSVEMILPWAGETTDGGVRETDAAVMRERLEASPQYRQQLERAALFGRHQAAVRPQDDDGPDADTLATRHRSAVDHAFTEYLAPFAAKDLPRAGFALGFARLLQYLQGLDSIRDAVIEVQDRNTFGHNRSNGSTDATAADGGAVIA